MDFKLMPLKHIAAAMMLGFVTISSWAAPVPAEKPSGLDRAEVLSVARKVADWQVKEFPNNPYAVKEPKGWIAGALYLGMYDWAELSGEEGYFNWLKKVFNRQYWQVADRMYHADDVCVSQTYIDMYNKYKEEKMLLPTLARIDWVINNPSKGGLDIDYSKPLSYERWSWCDALFMAPGVYTRLYTLTGNKKYMIFSDAEFKATYNHLYDKEEHLFFRDSRYFNQKEANGKKVFWGRGNGWVIGGLAEILKTLPENDTEYRPFYQQLFCELSERLAGLQNKDGFWHASLLDPDSYPSPETSATGFIVYGLAYGVNQGYLPADKYLPVIEKGWKALVSAVEPDGKLGWVQPVGADPKKVTRDMTELYGTGALLMAAVEIYKLSE
ncbi:MAG: glycoside hydrolase family 105 protein [Parabacteroides gordonii]|jgi:unsaturated rhamnogalacturonyl hydrolase|uniref:glycoside hydrolase family 88/105 protein n=1 Tax=Parabacteroides gordonii TaxID=574930 RepID=UPI003A89930E